MDKTCCDCIYLSTKDVPPFIHGFPPFKRSYCIALSNIDTSDLGLDTVTKENLKWIESIIHPRTSKDNAEYPIFVEIAIPRPAKFCCSFFEKKRSD